MSDRDTFQYNISSDYTLNNMIDHDQFYDLEYLHLGKAKSEGGSPSKSLYSEKETDMNTLEINEKVEVKASLFKVLETSNFQMDTTDLIKAKLYD